MLPQYHPKQLTVLLNAGRTKRVKAILLNVLSALEQRQVSVQNPLSRAATMRRMSTVGAMEEKSSDEGQVYPDYNEIEEIAPLPLHSIVAADVESCVEFHRKGESTRDVLMTNDSKQPVSTAFSVRHNRLLTELLTHTHLPGLSSVDQMHLLAIADTLSHFSADDVDDLSLANADHHATAATGVETVDECGLRFLMAVKQYEYLLLCLPINQRMELKMNGLPSSDIIWAQHSATESELLNAIPSLQKSNPTWDELRGLGIAWWLNDTTILKTCLEKLAKAAFQQNEDPMDSSLYYMALKKKNLLTHLFKTVKNHKMAEFFAQDFSKEHWQRIAAKNAFVLMGKQRFHHAAAFFLLSGSIKDAIQTILRKCRDLQLAMVVLRLYETDIEVQQAMLKEILCREVLGGSLECVESPGGIAERIGNSCKHERSGDPFLRSMAYWLLKDFSQSVHTLVQEAFCDAAGLRAPLSDIFNFYCFLRKHPLVVRQRVADAGVTIYSTEQFLAISKGLECHVTPSERRPLFGQVKVETDLTDTVIIRRNMTIPSETGLLTMGTTGIAP
nr:CRE-RBC-1 protein [Haemonchus contortus]